MAAKKRNVTTTGVTMPDWKMIRPDVKPYTQHGLRRDYERLLWEGEFYVHYEVADKTLASEFRKYCAKTFDKKDAALLKKLGDHRFTVIGKWTYLINKGATLDDDRLAKIEEVYNRLLAEVKADEPEEVVEDKPKAPVISIQDRMREQIAPLMSQLDEALDQFIDGELAVNGFDPYKMILGSEVAIKAPHAKLIRKAFEADADEAELVVAWKDEDIKEGYAHLSTAKQRKDYKAFLQKILTACDTVINAGKAARKPRVKKAPSKEKLVAKIKYLESDSKTGLASINPVSILEAQTVWVYNTRTRKLGVYRADEQTGPLSVKGASIVGYDQAKSLQRTVRKPEILKGAGKLARTKFDKLYNGLTTTEIKLNGRLNQHTIIVRAF